MTTKFEQDEARAERLNANIARMEALAKRLNAALMQRSPVDPALYGPSQEVYFKAFSAYMADMVHNPARMIEQQIGYWGKIIQNYGQMQQIILNQGGEVQKDPALVDKRFANPLWESHPFFHFLKQNYLAGADMMLGAVDRLEQLDPHDRHRAAYFMRQLVDMLAPTNFLATNPDALERAVETDGASLVQGLENLVRDVELGKGQLAITLSDPAAFEPGKNIATTAGDVVYRNDMYELIHYHAGTDKTYATPLLIFPPWINKYYILDLKPQNSMIKWLVDQGFDVFVVSWVNPDASYREVGLEGYVQDGFLSAMSETRRISGAAKINVVGYCIAGTTLGLTLAYLKKKKENFIKSATFFTTLTDFQDVGEIGAFLSEDFLTGIERQVAQDGVLDKAFMGRTFSFLRANDLIWQPAIKNYMMGEAPPAFDLLHWNGDGTNLPAKMAVDYLRGLYQGNQFAKGGIELLGERLHLADIGVPLCAVACEGDHIAPWKSCFKGIAQMGSREKIFILAQSGHIAGIINPPSKKKYGHYTSDAPLGEADEWRAQAQFAPAGWWPVWEKWLAARSGRKVKARSGDSHEVLEPAPGRYVRA